MEGNSSQTAQFLPPSESEGHLDIIQRKWKVEDGEKKYLGLQRETELIEY